MSRTPIPKISKASCASGIIATGTWNAFAIQLRVKPISTAQIRPSPIATPIPQRKVRTIRSRSFDGRWAAINRTRVLPIPRSNERR